MDLELLEALALSEDRSTALAQLLPGSEDCDYYQALHAQHRGAIDEADAVLQAWPDRHGRTPGYERLWSRQLLLRATAEPTDPRAAEQVRDWLGVSHWHEAEVEDTAPSRPSRLADSAFDPAALLRQAVDSDASLQQVSDEGITELVEWRLEPGRRRALLARLRHSTQPQIVDLVAEDLAQRSSTGFGSLAIHRELTLDQLHAVARIRTELKTHAGWAAAVVTRLRPPASVDLALDRDARAAYLDELWQFVADLPPASNSLRGHVLWHALDTARRRGAPIDRDRARAYLALPRNASYVARSWIDKVRREELAELGADFTEVTGLPPAGDDEALVRDLIQAEPDAAERYAPWLDRAWLDAEVAAARLLAGDRDADRATLALGPARAAALRDRIEIAWCAHNPSWFASDAPIALEVDVKNVAELLVKVFRIDPLAFFQLHHREVDAGLDLDGLAASHEQVLRFTEPPIRRVRRRIDLPVCARPGCYVIDLIGNGISSRAVIHKGRLRQVMQIGPAGHSVTIVDDTGRVRPDARAWLGDREYVPDADGAFVVPFASAAQRTPVLLSAGDVASVSYLQLSAETPALSLALMLDRQSLTCGRSARAIARLGLTVGGAPASLFLLRQASWEITATDRHGVASTRSQPLDLDDGDAAVLEWPVGDDTADIALTVRGRIEIHSAAREREVSASRSFRIATMYAGPTTEALYLARGDWGWILSALGKTGEPRAHRPVTVSLAHRWAHVRLNAELATDERGRIELGELPGARQLTATLGNRAQSWELDDPPPASAALYAPAGTDVLAALPASRTADSAIRRASLVELRGGAPARHAAAELVPLAGAIAIRGLPPGDYQLRAPGLPVTPITVAAPAGAVAGWAIGPTALIQTPRPAPAIESTDRVDGQLVLQLRGAGPRTRVHVIATRFAPALTEPVRGGPAVSPQRWTDPPLGAHYVSGRELGDEYRYVLERRSAPRFPGLLIDKPSLLLDPWARRTTTTEIAAARPGGTMPPRAAAARMAEFAGRTVDMPRGAGEELIAGYDFLGAPPIVQANLVPDAAGAIRVALAGLAGATTITAIVDDPAGGAALRIALAEPALEPRDLRLQLALDPDRHAAQRKRIAPLAAGARLEIDDVATAKLHLIDTVERAHTYLLALRDDPDLRRFAFITRWHTLPDSERRELYSQHACHELHLFLHAKDRGFFDAVIRPHLQHKRVKTFVDHWLLGHDLTGDVEPARLARLNAVERALLAQRVTDGDAIARQLDDEIAIQPPDPGRDARLIDALLGGAVLEERGQLLMSREFEEPAASAAPSAPPAAPMAGRAMGMAGAGGPPPGMAPGGAVRGQAKSRADNQDARLAFETELARVREATAPSYRPIDKTQEWSENNWWQRTPQDSDPAMIPPSRLWRDLARHRGGSFLSPSLGLATGSFAEAMCALAVTDLAFVAPDHAITTDGPRLAITAAGNALAGSSQLVTGELVTGGAPLVVGMTYVRADDRQDWSSGEPVDKYVTGPLATGVVYTCQVVLANPTSVRQRVEALIQIPRGSIAVAGARPTHTIDAVLEPYGTHGHEYSFYFPFPGASSHFPVHVSRGGQIVAAAAGRALEVASEATAPDERSWSYVSQRAGLAEVTAYLAAANLAAIELGRVAWRVRDRAAYDAILGAIEARRAFDPTLWSYALLHGDPSRIRAYLRTRGSELLTAGPVLDMLGLDAEDLGSYEHLELAPLINARAHRLGPRLALLNDGLAAQYTRFLELVAHRRAATAEDLLAAAHYLLAQDRVAPALAALGRIDPDHPEIADRMQYDYLAGYAACLTGELGRAREIAARWRDHPVDHWGRRFAALAAMLAEVGGAGGELTDPRSREQRHAELAARQPAFEIVADRDGVLVRSANLAGLELRFFELDVELLFSRQPFVQSDVSRFSYIDPVYRQALALTGVTGAEQRVAWPAQLGGKNLVVEAVGAGIRKAAVHYANDLATQLSHQYGQVRVQRASSSEPLAATYVKVYARKRAGQVAFYKDGYTDLRGWFDYASLSTNELDTVERFAILVCSDQAGAAILEAGAPAR